MEFGEQARGQAEVRDHATRSSPRRARVWGVLVAAVAVVASTCAGLAGAFVTATPASATPTLPEGFTWTALPSAPDGTSSGQPPFQLTDFELLPSGGLISTGQAGAVRYVAPDGTARDLLTLPVESCCQLGLLGIALAKDYETSGHLYLFFTDAPTVPDTAATIRLAQFTVDNPDDPTTLTDETQLLDPIPAYIGAHVGGAIVVDPTDGTLFVGIGDSANYLFADPNSLAAQDLTDPHGKILHINTDGSAVESNPFFNDAAAGSWESKVYAYGFREPFRMSMRPDTHTLYVGDVGWSTAEELDVVQPGGGNYGWPCWEGAAPTPPDAVGGDFTTMAPCTSPNASAENVVAPLWSYEHDGVSSAVAGGVFATGTDYPEQYQGAFFFGDYERQDLWALNVDSGNHLETGPGVLDPSTPFATSIGGPTRFRTGPDGDVYMADLHTGTIWHLGYTAPGPTLSPIALHYLGLGGPFSFLGPPVGPEQDVAGGRWQPFLGGSIYWSASTGAHEVHGAIRGLYESLGGPSSLGFPSTDETSTFLGTGRFNSFQNGSIYWSPATGAHEVRDDIRGAWSSLGWEFGFLGFPVTGDTPTLFGTGHFNHFEGGSIYSSPSTGAHEVHGAIRDEWASLGWEFGFLGFPVTNETPAPDGVGRYNKFQGGWIGGWIYWSPSTGAHEVHGAIGALYESLGGASSSLGYPVTDEGSIFGTARISVFEHGVITWNPESGAQVG